MSNERGIAEAKKVEMRSPNWVVVSPRWCRITTASAPVRKAGRVVAVADAMETTSVMVRDSRFIGCAQSKQQ
jgi:hypothetical protein